MSKPKIYALQVTTGQEQTISDKLMIKHPAIKTILPERELFEKTGFTHRIVRRTMLPGYLFLQADSEYIESHWSDIRHADGVLGILGALDRADADRLMALSNNGDVWGVSRGAMHDGTITVTDGPLVGREDWIVCYDRHRSRAKVRIWIGNRPALIGLTLIIQ